MNIIEKETILYIKVREKQKIQEKKVKGSLGIVRKMQKELKKNKLSTRKEEKQ